MESIVAVLRGESQEDQNSAYTECEALDDQQVIDELASAVRSGDISEKARQRLARGLGKVPGTVSEQHVLDLLADSDPNMRGMACIGLAQRPEMGPVTCLIESLADDVNTVRNLAERGLIDLVETVPDLAVPGLLELLGSDQPLTRSPAARLLGLAGDSRALQPLLALLDEEDWLTRMWACQALGDLGDKAACSAVTEKAQADPKNRVRASAVLALGKLKCEGAEETIRAAMKDSDAGVQNSASDALVAMGLSAPEDEFDIDAFD